MSRDNRVIYLDILRIISIFAVIVIHAAAMNWYTQPVNTLAWASVNFYTAVSRFCVPVMFMISGALFLNQDINLKKLWSKNILRIVTAFLFWSFLYAVPYWANMLLMHMDIVKSSGLHPVKGFYDELMRGHFHQWFLYALLPLYILTPFIRKFVNDKILIKYFLILSFIFASLVPTLRYMPFIDALVAIPADSLKLGTVLFSQYAFYFVLGYYLNIKDLPDKIIKLIYAAGIFGTIITIYGTVLISRAAAKPSHILLDYLTPFTVCQSAAIFLFVKQIFAGGGVTHLSSKIKSKITDLSVMSFGIYLVHDFFNILIVKFKINIFLLDRIPLVSVLIISALVFMLSLSVSWLLHKIPVLKDYIV